MTALRAQFLAEAGGDYFAAAVLFAKALMEGDEATFKAGYTAENAAIAAEEVFPDTTRIEVLEALTTSGPVY